MTHCEKITIAILRVAASFERALMMYCRIGNLRAEALGAPGFRSVAVALVFFGKALEMRVEKESMIMRLVFCGGWVDVGLARSAMRCERVGVEKLVRFEASDERVCGFEG